MSVPACYKRLWIARQVDAGFYPMIFHKKPEIIKRGLNQYIFDYARDAEVEILWCREYRQRKYREGHKGRT